MAETKEEILGRLLFKEAEKNPKIKEVLYNVAIATTKNVGSRDEGKKLETIVGSARNERERNDYD